MFILNFVILCLSLRSILSNRLPRQCGPGIYINDGEQCCKILNHTEQVFFVCALSQRCPNPQHFNNTSIQKFKFCIDETRTPEKSSFTRSLNDFNSTHLLNSSNKSLSITLKSFIPNATT